MRNIGKILLFLGITTLLVGLAMLNADRIVSVTYLPGVTVERIPVALVILGSMFVGVVVAGLVTLVDQLRERRRIRSLERQISALQREIRELRNRPLDTEDPAPAADGGES